MLPARRRRGRGGCGSRLSSPGRSRRRSSFWTGTASVLSGILESFTGTLELREVLRRIVTVTREELGADRAWLLHPVNEEAEFAKVAFATFAPGIEGDLADKGPVSLAK